MALSFTFNPFTGNFDAINSSSGSGTITDWANDLTFTPSAGWGTVSGLDVWYRRVGDSMQVRGYFVAGTVAGSTSFIALPAAHTLDSSKLPTGVVAMVGHMVALDSGPPTAILGTTSTTQIVFVDTSNTTDIFFAFRGTAAQYNKDNVSTAGAISGFGISFEFDIPIVEFA